MGNKWSCKDIRDEFKLTLNAFIKAHPDFNPDDKTKFYLQWFYEAGFDDGYENGKDFYY